MNKRPDPPIELLKQLLAYEPETGLMRWKVAASPTAQPGEIAGSSNQLGYVKIVIKGVHRGGHRVAWALYYGEWPKNTIDHINGDPSDNRIANLRDCSMAENAINKRGLRGVSKVKDGKWQAAIGFKGVRRHLGSYDTEEEAHEAYKQESLRLHGEFSPFFEHSGEPSRKSDPSPLPPDEVEKLAIQARKISDTSRHTDIFLQFARAIERAHGIA